MKKHTKTRFYTITIDGFLTNKIQYLLT